MQTIGQGFHYLYVFLYFLQKCVRLKVSVQYLHSIGLSFALQTWTKPNLELLAFPKMSERAFTSTPFLMKHAGAQHQSPAAHAGPSVHAAPEFCHLPHTAPQTSMPGQGKIPLQMMHLMAAEGEDLALVSWLGIMPSSGYQKRLRENGYSYSIT